MNVLARIDEPAVEHAPAASDLPLRFITCGSVDDGKSTLIGRLLWDSKAVKQDQADGLQNASGGAQNSLGLPDFALLLDGLQAEREQGITIDVAYRYFSSGRRSFIVADTPGHEQYTRNMATGASTADVAVILVDARNGILEQTRRHASIAALMGIRHLILAVNKIDLTAYDRQRFQVIETAFRELASTLGVNSIVAIPVSALKGENVVSAAPDGMPWYSGPTLIEALDAAPSAASDRTGFRFPVQRVVRPDEGFRGYQGTVAGGIARVGDTVAVMPGNRVARIATITTFEGSLENAETGDAVTLTLDRNIDIARGDIIVPVAETPLTGTSFEARLIVLDDDGLDPSKRYWLKTAGRRQRVSVTPDSALDLGSGDWRAENRFAVNTIGNAHLRFEDAAVFDRYEANRTTGAFILIDPDTNNTVAGGMITGSREPSAGFEEAEQVVIKLPAAIAEKLLAHEDFAEIRAYLRTDEAE